MAYKSVLIIDDDPTQFTILSAYFQRIGAEAVKGAENAARALTFLNDENFGFDLIVSDLQMPEMDGIELLRHLKSIRFKGELVIISGVQKNLLEHAGRLAKMQNLNITGHLSKPVSKNALDRLFLRDAKGTESTAKPKPQHVITNNDFDKALTDGEIFPVFQPKIDLTTGRIAGAEALARWEKPNVGFISPDKLFSFAEDMGRLEELTFYLFDKAAGAIKHFVNADPSQKFATNLAPALISNLSLPDRLVNLIRHHKLNLENFSFEVTENSILNLDPVTLEVLSRLRIYGFDLAIDDFGTGSSNIQTLRDFPYSELKIDRAFISNATTDAFSRETVHAAVALATEQNMRIVAEGVESIESLNFIQKNGVHEVQGFLISKPLKAKEYLEFIAGNAEGIDLMAYSCSGKVA